MARWDITDFAAAISFSLRSATTAYYWLQDRTTPPTEAANRNEGDRHEPICQSRHPVRRRRCDDPGNLSPASADDWRWRRHHRDRGGDALAAGVVGLAAGAIIAGALSQPRYREPAYYDDYDPYYEPRPRYVVRPRPVVRQYYRYAGAIEPWSPEWYSYCSNRYRSFNARSGTFTGYDGLQHFCNAN